MWLATRSRSEAIHNYIKINLHRQHVNMGTNGGSRAASKTRTPVKGNRLDHHKMSQELHQVISSNATSNRKKDPEINGSLKRNVESQSDEDGDGHEEEGEDDEELTRLR